MRVAQIQAEDALVHYFRQLYNHAGLLWTSENEDEIRNIVRNILQAAAEADVS